MCPLGIPSKRTRGQQGGLRGSVPRIGLARQPSPSKGSCRKSPALPDGFSSIEFLNHFIANVFHLFSSRPVNSVSGCLGAKLENISRREVKGQAICFSTQEPALATSAPAQRREVSEGCLPALPSTNKRPKLKRGARLFSELFFCESTKMFPLKKGYGEQWGVPVPSAPSPQCPLPVHQRSKDELNTQRQHNQQ